MIAGFDLLYIGIILVLALLYNRWIKSTYPKVQLSMLDGLLAFHYLLAMVYFLYAQYNNSDSHHYFAKVVQEVRGENWLSYFGTGTPFIEFVAWPFVHGLQMGYHGLMALFAFFGYIGMSFFYLLIKENIRFNHPWMGTMLFPLVLFLPNMHFWSGSLGKGSIILMGIGAFFFALSRPGDRWLLAVIALALVYMIRPHIAFVFLASVGLALLLGNKDLKVQHKLGLFFLAALTLILVYDRVFSYIGLVGEDPFEEGFNFTTRLAEKLSTRADSGVDISNYNFVQKIFAFLFFPLFFNANSAFSFVVSIENLFYLLIILQIFRLSFIRYFFKAQFITKVSFLSFLGSVVALSQITGNMGIAIRMKSMVMMLMIFVILQFMDFQRWRVQWVRYKRYARKVRVMEENVEQPTTLA